MKVEIELGKLSKKTLMRIAMEISNPNTLDQIVEFTRSELVLAAIAGNRFTRKSTLIALSKSKHIRVSNAALKTLEALG